MRRNGTNKKESDESRKKRAEEIVARLKKTYPHAKIALRYKTTWELLVAVILSAQCTDKKVNEVTGKLFSRYRTFNDSVRADEKEFARLIRSTGFYRAKTRAILTSAKIVKEKFGGKVPRTMAEMLTLRGVARKTANVVLGNAYGVVEGIAVDTHVRRLSQRLGLSASENPEKIEQDLMALLPKKEWFTTTYLLINHGRAICTAKDPRCDLCPLRSICPSAFRFPRFTDKKTNPSRQK